VQEFQLLHNVFLVVTEGDLYFVNINPGVYNIKRKVVRMKTSDLVRELCKKQHISLAELSRRIGQSPQNLNKKLKKDTLSVEELNQIAEATGTGFDLGFVFPDGVKISNETGQEE